MVHLSCPQMAQKIKDENGEGEIVHMDDGNEQAISPEELEAFEKHLPLGSKQVGLV